MLTRLFRGALCLYPRAHRAVFGTEMVEVFDRSRAEAWAGGIGSRLAFCVREGAGLLTEALRLRARGTDFGNESWMRSLEAPALASAFYGLGVVASHDAGIWGFFVPGMYLMVAVLMVAGAWLVGRTCTVFGSRRRYGTILVAVLVSTLIVPVVIRATEDIWMRSLSTPHLAIDFDIPGIQVRSVSGPGASARGPGLTFTKVMGDRGGTMTRSHYRTHDSPSYLLLGALLSGIVAFVSRRRACA